MSLVSILLGDTLVGEIERFDDEFDSHVFRFASSYLLSPKSKILGQLFEDRRPNEIVTHGFTPWFEHVLPQGPLRGAVAGEAAVDEGDGLGLLVWLGEDLPGAIRVVADGSKISRRSPRVLPKSTGEKLFRASLAGIQWKMSLRPSERGLTVPLIGESGEWIAKFHSDSFRDLVRIENATMSWAAKSGVVVPEHSLVHASVISNLPRKIPLGDGQVFLVRRFDRSPEARVHTEDFGQILDCPPGRQQYGGGYERILKFLVAEAPSSVERFLRQLVFCVVAGNGDAHLKNWSVVYRDGRHPELSPGYDLVSTVLGSSGNRVGRTVIERALWGRGRGLQGGSRWHCETSLGCGSRELST